MGAETHIGPRIQYEQYSMPDIETSPRENVLTVDPNTLMDAGSEVDIDEAKNLLEGQGGIIEHKNRYGTDPSKCPFLGAMGTAGILLAERLESAHQDPNRGKTIIELLAERRQETSTKEQKNTEANALPDSKDSVSKFVPVAVESSYEKAQSLTNHLEAEVFMAKLIVPDVDRQKLKPHKKILGKTKKAVPLSTWAKKPTKSGHKKIMPLGKTNPKPQQKSVKSIEKILPDKVQKASESVVRKKQPSKKTVKKTNSQKAENNPINIKKTTNSVTVTPNTFKEPEQISFSSPDLSAITFEVSQQPYVVNQATELETTSIDLTEDEFAIQLHEVVNIEPGTEVLYEEGAVENEATGPVLYAADVGGDIDLPEGLEEKKHIKVSVPIAIKPETLELQTEEFISKKIDQILEIVSDVSAQSLPAQEIRVLFEEIIAYVSLAVGDVLEKDDVIKLVDDFMSQLTQSLANEYLIPEVATHEHKVAINNLLAKYTSSLSHIETRFLLIAKYVIHQMLIKKPEQNPVQAFA